VADSLSSIGGIGIEILLISGLLKLYQGVVVDLIN
jgi:hypothetical protein